MRKLAIIGMMFLAGSAFAKQGVTRPKFKNTNAWEVKKMAAVLNVKSVVTPELKSPELKNLQVWQRKSTTDMVVVVGNRKIHDLQGPKRKN
jgi:hypothetical protein